MLDLSALWSGWAELRPVGIVKGSAKRGRFFSRGKRVLNCWVIGCFPGVQHHQGSARVR